MFETQLEILCRFLKLRLIINLHAKKEKKCFIKNTKESGIS
jgi:hypothetical protein